MTTTDEAAGRMVHTPTEAPRVLEAPGVTRLRVSLADPERAAELLRGLGWKVIAPVDPAAEIPETSVGQVWRSPNARIADRTITRMARSSCYRDTCLCPHFLNREGRETHLHPVTFRNWARKSGARPVTP